MVKMPMADADGEDDDGDDADNDEDADEGDDDEDADEGDEEVPRRWAKALHVQAKPPFEDCDDRCPHLGTIEQHAKGNQLATTGLEATHKEVKTDDKTRADSAGTARMPAKVLRNCPGG